MTAGEVPPPTGACANTRDIFLRARYETGIARMTARNDCTDQ